MIGDELQTLFDNLGEAKFAQNPQVKELQDQRTELQTREADLSQRALDEKITSLSNDKGWIASLPHDLPTLFGAVKAKVVEDLGKTNVSAEDMVPFFESALLGIQRDNSSAYLLLRKAIRDSDLETSGSNAANLYAASLALDKVESGK